MKSSQGDEGQFGFWSSISSDAALEAQRAEFLDGQIVYGAGAPASRIYFIHSGQVRIYQAGPDESARLLEILGPGDWFGEDALASADVYSAKAVVVAEAVLWAVPIDHLMDSLCRKPQLAMELIRQLATRLQAARQDASRFVFDDCGVRLVKALLRFSGTAAATPQENGDVLLRITHRQLAQAVGAARETVSLALTHLRQRNVLRTGRNRLMFNPSSLEAFAYQGNGPSA